MDRRTALDICVNHEGSDSETLKKNNELSDDQLITKAKSIQENNKPIYEVFLDLKYKNFYLGV